MIGLGTLLKNDIMLPDATAGTTFFLLAGAAFTLVALEGFEFSLASGGTEDALAMVMTSVGEICCMSILEMSRPGVTVAVVGAATLLCLLS